MSAPREKSVKLPFVVYLLGIGAFLMGTTEFIVAGILPEPAADLSVGVSQAGLLITAFAIGMMSGHPAAAPPVVTGLAVRFAGDAPTLAAALANFSFNVGIAASSWIAGSALDSSFGLTGPALVCTVMAACSLVPLAALGAIRATHTPTPPPPTTQTEIAHETDVRHTTV